jgi:FAD synthetase
MTQDAPSHQDGPRVNGVAEPVSASGSDAPRTLREICDELRRKLTDFLGKETDNKLLRGVQKQVRVSMGVIEEAMARYQYVMLPQLNLETTKRLVGSRVHGPVGVD